MASFNLGTNNPYWSNTQPERESKFLPGAAGILGAGAFLGAGFIPYGNGNVFDIYYKVGRVAAHSFPMGLLASVRFPEAISPFISRSFQSNNLGYVDFGSEFLNSPQSLAWLSNVTGQSEAQLASLGVGSGSSLRFTRHTGFRGIFGGGRLSLISSGGQSVNVSDNIMLLERQLTSNEYFSINRNINQFAEAAASVVNENLDMRQAFVSSQNSDLAHKYIPFPSLTGSNRFSYIRGIFAFEAQRLNRATETIVENIPILGEIIKPYLNTEGLLIKNGPALKMYARTLGLTGKIAAAGLAVSQYDYFMRYKSDNAALKEAGYLFSSAAVGYGFLRHFNKVASPTLRNKAGAIGLGAAAISYLGQNVLSGFDKGLVAGVTKTASNLSIFSSEIGEFIGASDFRREIEDVFPGFSDVTTSVYFGLGTLGLYSLRHRSENRYVKFAQHMSAELDRGGFTGINRAKQALTNLDLHYRSWEKVGANLSPTDDLDAYRAMIANGVSFKNNAPGKLLNEAFEQTWQGYKTSGAGVFMRLKGLFSHFSSSSYSEFRGFKGAYVAFGLGYMVHALATRRVFGTVETPEQLRKQAEGKELIPVRKSRFWGMGGTPYEGGKISYYKPSLTATIMSDSENYAKWGEDVKRYSPITRWFLENFSYTLEEKNFYDRPYPITSPGFANTPFFGDFLGATIGSLVKPQKTMHVNEWQRITDTLETEYLNVPKKLDSNPSMRLGGTGIRTPINPYDIREVYGEVQYKLREASGLIGFIQNQFQKTFTGSETYSTDRQYLAESGAMYDLAKSFWNLEIGGAATLSEIPRRFLPKEREQARNRYNPIRNTMPSWLPEEFKRGDPYTSIQSGFARLPGAGFAALHPELKGIAPEDYPLFSRYQILANVAPYSDEYRKAKINVMSMRKKGQLTVEQAEEVETIEKQLAAQRIRRNYFIESKEQQEQPVIKRKLRDSYLHFIDMVKNISAPVEYLTFGGFRPSQKYLPVTSALSDYERYAIYGSETSFWDLSRSWRDYLGPAFYSTIKLLGYKGVPGELRERRDIDEYFDKLKYYKYMKLHQEAKNNGNYEDAASYKKMASKTVYGVNPYAHPLSIYSALPQAEKDRFDGFLAIKDPKDRKRLLEILPDNQKQIFEVLWSRQDKEKGRINVLSDSEKMSELELYFSKKGLPREDFIGWNAEVDLNDVKLKYIKSLNYSIFDFGFWPNDEKLIERKPYLEGAEEYLVPQNRVYRNAVNKIYNNLHIKHRSIIIENHGSMAPGKTVVNMNDNREGEIRKQYRLWNEN